jgi:thiamine-monophosphate kinase
MSRSSEDALIARYFAPLATLPGSERLIDDAALISPSAGHAFVVTADMLVSSVHFLPDDPADTIARKALRVNLSDLAAKGAVPYGFLLSLALPENWTEPWLASFASGLAADAGHYRFPLIGGDTVSTPGPLTVSVTALGTVPEGKIPRRAGAQPGDKLCVTGTIGDGALGLILARGTGEIAGAALDEGQRAVLLARYRLPQPRVALADLVRREASAAMDISDGLVGDLGKLCRASGVTAMVDLDAVPLSEPARIVTALSPGLVELAMTGGDDYEILCAVPASLVRGFVSQASRLGVAVTPIGDVAAGEGEPTFLREGNAYRFARRSFSHF